MSLLCYCFTCFPLKLDYFLFHCAFPAALLLKLEKRISEVPIESKELGFTKPGPYIYELLADLNITQKTATMLIDITEEACLLLEEGTKPPPPWHSRSYFTILYI